VCVRVSVFVCGVGGPGRSWVVLLCVADAAPALREPPANADAAGCQQKGLRARIGPCEVP
jgi:hypothetical protein